MSSLGLGKHTKPSGYVKPTLDSIRRMREGNTLEDQEEAGKLNVSGMEEGYYYHVVNDKNGGLEKMKRRGYEVVQQDGKIVMGDSNPEEVGSLIQATCDKEEGTKAVLMRIPQEFKDEDDKYRQSKVDKTEEALYKKEESEEGRYGSIDQKAPS